MGASMVRNPSTLRMGAHIAEQVEYNDYLYIFGGMPYNDTAPTNKIMLFSLKTREWQVPLTPLSMDAAPIQAKSQKN